MKDEKEEGNGVVPVLIAIGIMLVVFLIMTSTEASRTWEDNKLLGQSICSEEYDADFVSFYNGILTCKPRGGDNIYGEIKVNLNENTGLCAY